MTLGTTRITYTGATPGANTNTYPLFSTVTAFDNANMLPMMQVKRYVLRLEFSRAGTLNWYTSSDRGTNWRVVGTSTLTPAAAGTGESVTLDVLVEGFQDFKCDFVNGGTAQEVFIVDQSLDTDRSPAV